MSAPDPYGLARFVTAQEPVMTRVMDELKAGRKETHWMWFVFPQLRGLGRSSTARFYGIASFEEACAYLGHPALGPRLDLCTGTVLAVANRSAHDIFGSPDDLKFRSSMTLFALAAGGSDSLYHHALGRWWHGAMDPVTLRLLGIAAPG